MPDDMEIEWTLGVDFPDSYTLQLPQGSQASLAQQLSTGATSTSYTISHPWQQGGAQKLAFDVVVTRTTCTAGEQVLSIQANPVIKTIESEAEIEGQNGGAKPQPARLVIPVVDAVTPTLNFDGPIIFESVGATANGLESDISHGIATIVISGEWDPCTTWTVDLSGTVDVPAETPAKFWVVSINNEPISGDACDLSGPCDVIVLPETGDAATPLRYTIGLELQLHEYTPLGEFGISLESDVRGEGTQP